MIDRTWSAFQLVHWINDWMNSEDILSYRLLLFLSCKFRNLLDHVDREYLHTLQGCITTGFGGSYIYTHLNFLEQLLLAPEVYLTVWTSIFSTKSIYTMI